ncbi:uncharacterized protein LOC142587076 [Dermacentor variabilis]|uniref:uncharacterized protein LOC142587076 n=1 Tax=Dermacentor variabilis TaxID=34621 RepID=UPI003F5C0873
MQRATTVALPARSALFALPALQTSQQIPFMRVDLGRNTWTFSTSSATMNSMSFTKEDTGYEHFFIQQLLFRSDGLSCGVVKYIDFLSYERTRQMPSYESLNEEEKKKYEDKLEEHYFLMVSTNDPDTSANQCLQEYNKYAENSSKTYQDNC